MSLATGDCFDAREAHQRRSSWPVDAFTNKDQLEEQLFKDRFDGAINGVDIDNIKMILQCVVAMHRHDEPCKCPINCSHFRLPDDDEMTNLKASPRRHKRKSHTRSKSHLPNANNYNKHNSHCQERANRLTVPVEESSSAAASSNSSWPSTSSSFRRHVCPSLEDPQASCTCLCARNSCDRQLKKSATSDMSLGVASASSDSLSSGTTSLTLPPLELILQDQYILRELSEMRAMVERFLDSGQPINSEWDLIDTEEILNLFGLSFADSSSSDPKEPTPHFPTGDWLFEECGVCLELNWFYRRCCCNYNVCIPCLQQYYSSRVQLGSVTVECINPDCHSFVHRDEIAARLSPEMKQVYYKLLLARNLNDRQKTCPQCNHLLRLDDEQHKKMHAKRGVPLVYKVQCSECEYFWCFKCHAPWHEEMTCKQYRKGDRLLKSWAKETVHGQVNAQRCPKCRIFIQRTSGCDHMHCCRCKTDFCYKCGDKLRRIKFFGDHHSKLSIFGCKYRYKADNPFQRKLIRGAVFGSKLMLVPVLGSLAVAAGAVVVAVGVAALPLYGGMKLYRKYQDKKLMKNRQANVNNRVENIFWSAVIN